MAAVFTLETVELYQSYFKISLLGGTVSFVFSNLNMPFMATGALATLPSGNIEQPKTVFKVALTVLPPKA